MAHMEPSSSGRYQSAQAAQHQKAESAAQMRRLKEEVEIQALSVFFSTLSQNGGGDSTAKSGKIQQVGQELKEGLVTPQQAAMMIFEIVNNSKETVHLGMPDLTAEDLKNPKTQVVMHTEFFGLFLNEKMKMGGASPSLLQKTIDLANQLAENRISPQEGAQQLAGLIMEVNKNLPSSEQYPNKIGPELFAR